MEIPSKFKNLIGEKFGIKDNLSLSGASVYLFDDMVLKIQNLSKESENEYKMMCWLDGKLPVPKIIEFDKTNKLSYLLMSKCIGEMACCKQLMNNPKQQTELLAQTLFSLWNIDISDCPSDQSLDNKLAQAEYNVNNNLVDIENCEPGTFGDGGYSSPKALLDWLQNNKPDEEPVLSHGDFCLPNVLFADRQLSGLIDLGRSGKADKWCGIALCYRSLINNYNGTYTGEAIFGFCDSYLFDALQIKPDWEKIRYYILLDELF